jgi:hypothetical protein
MPGKLNSFKIDSDFVLNAIHLWKIKDEAAHPITQLRRKHGCTLQQNKILLYKNYTQGGKKP